LAYRFTIAYPEQLRAGPPHGGYMVDDSLSHLRNADTTDHKMSFEFGLQNTPTPTHAHINVCA
jgi:hypothetical protein